MKASPQMNSTTAAAAALKNYTILLDKMGKMNVKEAYIGYNNKGELQMYLHPCQKANTRITLDEVVSFINKHKSLVGC